MGRQVVSRAVFRYRSTRRVPTATRVISFIVDPMGMCMRFRTRFLAPAARRLAAMAFAGSVLIGGAQAHAADEEDTPSIEEEVSQTGNRLTLDDRIRAVSRKVFLKEGRFELSPFGGMTINDAFVRRWLAGGRLTYHIAENFAVDVGGGYNLVDEKLNPIRVAAGEGFVTSAARVQGLADISGTFSPAYGKIALMSEWILHYDLFVTGGAGAVFDASGVHPALQLGAGARFYMNRWMVLRVDLRDYIYPQDRSGIAVNKNLMFLNVGIGFFFPMDFEYKYQAYRVVG